jgi:hypothetical protein
MAPTGRTKDIPEFAPKWFFAEKILENIDPLVENDVERVSLF